MINSLHLETFPLQEYPCVVLFDLEQTGEKCGLYCLLVIIMASSSETVTL